MFISAILLLIVFSSSVKRSLPAAEGKSSTQVPCEATNKEAFYSRVESYSISFFYIKKEEILKVAICVYMICQKFSLVCHCLKWAGKPRTLSPLLCARYGWINVGCDMLKCSSCQAFLCTSLPPTLDYEKCR